MFAQFFQCTTKQNLTWFVNFLPLQCPHIKYNMILLPCSVCVLQYEKNCVHCVIYTMLWCTTWAELRPIKIIHLCKTCGTAGSGSGSGYGSSTLVNMRSLKRGTYHVLRGSRGGGGLHPLYEAGNFFFFCGSFLPSCIRIRIHWPDWIRIQSGSGSATLIYTMLWCTTRATTCLIKIIYLCRKWKVSRGEPTMSSVAAEAAAASILSTRPGMSFAILPSIDSRYIGN